MLNFTLPWPPSVNRMWRTISKGPLAGRTLLSEEGREYRRQVNLQVTLQRITRRSLSGKLAVHITAYPPDRRRRDIDNLLKAVLDSLQHAEVIDDDGEIDVLSIARRGVKGAGQLTLVISEIAGEATETAPLGFVNGGAARSQTEVV